MGLDFIKSKAGKPFKKTWANAVDAIKEPDLFAMPASTTRTVVMNLHPGATVEIDEQLIAQRIDALVKICRDFVVIGEIPNPPDDLLISLAAHGDVCQALIRRVGLFGDSAEIELK